MMGLNGLPRMIDNDFFRFSPWRPPVPQPTAFSAEAGLCVRLRDEQRRQDAASYWKELNQALSRASLVTVPSISFTHSFNLVRFRDRPRTFHQVNSVQRVHRYMTLTH